MPGSIPSMLSCQSFRPRRRSSVGLRQNARPEGDRQDFLHPRRRRRLGQPSAVDRPRPAQIDVLGARDEQVEAHLVVQQGGGVFDRAQKPELHEDEHHGERRSDDGDGRAAALMEEVRQSESEGGHGYELRIESAPVTRGNRMESALPAFLRSAGAAIIPRRHGDDHAMKCQRCPKPATLHITEVLPSDKYEEFHFCEDCAKKYLHPAGTGQKSKGVGIELGDDPSTLQCRQCGIKFVEFRNSGRLGCAHDYEHFAAELLPLFESIHGDTRHTGKRPRRGAARPPEQNELVQLRRKLQEAVSGTKPTKRPRRCGIASACWKRAPPGRISGNARRTWTTDMNPCQFCGQPATIHLTDILHQAERPSRTCATLAPARRKSCPPSRARTSTCKAWCNW